MRLLLLTGIGTEGNTLVLAEALRGRGLQVETVQVGFSRGNGWLSVSVERQGSVTDLNISGRLAAWVSGHYPMLLRVLRKRLAPLIDADTVVHAFGLHPLGAVGQRLAERAGARFVLSPTAPELLNGLAHLPRHSWRKAALQSAHTVIVEADVLKGKSGAPGNVTVIAPAVADDGLGFRSRPMGSTINFVMMGRWDEERPVVARPKLAMKALAQAERELGRPVILSVIGSGTRVPELMRYAKGLKLHVSFHGDLKGSGLARELQRADFFLHPTDFATFPTYMLQALKCGIPVIASDVDGMDLFLGDGTNGMLVGNKLSLWMDGMVRAYRDYFDHEAIASANSGRFTLETWVQGVFETYSASS
ncbi:MAG: glycosyltransferase family 4 protein [Flavobacteriales bacterium]|nr:glycosyltransferase family 4 protein [Flavobacteriales bacterium]